VKNKDAVGTAPMLNRKIVESCKIKYL